MAKKKAGKVGGKGKKGGMMGKQKKVRGGVAKPVPVERMKDKQI